MEDRKVTLLKACYDMLSAIKRDGYLDSITVRYDQAECDVYCLLEDIEVELGL